MDLPRSYQLSPPLDEDTIALLYPRNGSYKPSQNLTPQVVPSTKQRRVPIFTGVLPTMLVVFLSGGLAVFLLIWLRMHQAEGILGYEPGFLTAIRNGTFIVDEGYKEDGQVIQASLRALTFSSVAGHVVGLTSSFLMTLVAYRTASQWLETSQSLRQGAEDQNPTPVQYGLLLGLLGASNIMSVYNAIRYALRSKKRRSKLPSIFIQPLIIASVVLVLNHALGVGDLWLHTTARSAVITVDVPGGVPDLSALKLGVAFNESLCDPSIQHELPLATPCLQYFRFWGGVNSMLSDAWRVINNSTSAAFRIITLADHNNTAVIVPASVPALKSRTSTAYTFSAATLAVRSDCEIITRACIRDQSNGVTDCTPAGAPYLPLRWDNVNGTPPPCQAPGCFQSKIFGVVDGSIGKFLHGDNQYFPENLTLPSGPVTLGIQLQMQQTNLFPVETSACAIDGLSRVFGICRVVFLNGILTYDPSENEYRIVSEAYVPSNLTGTLWGPLITQYGTDRLVSDISGLVMGEQSVDPTSLINANLAKLALGLLGGVVRPVAATQASLVRQGVFGLYPVVPVVYVSGILFAYALFAVFIFFTSVSSKSYTVSTTASLKGHGGEGYPPAARSSNATNEGTALVLGQIWLTDPLPLVAALFSGNDRKDPQRSITDDSLDMVFDADGRASRLLLGVTAVGEETKFGLKRGERDSWGKEKVSLTSH
ncbi:hypothetical protein FS837_002205 [Tulasnella sp. UAMH 9824]|nr:hypothetical protein FS837_002205 [Tulasnella sp. UAMH 9824]